MTTVPNLERRTRYAPVSLTTSFPVGFTIYAAADVAVYINGANVAQADATYPWTLTAVFNAAGECTNATVVAGGSGWSGVTVDIVGQIAPYRVDQFQDNAGIPASAFNLILNRLVAAMREGYDRSVRSLRLPFGQAVDPLPTLTAGALLMVNPAANGVMMGPTAGAISGAQSAATAAAASASLAAQLTAGVSSSTSNAVGTGSKTFTVAAGLSLAAGLYVQIVDTNAPTTNSMNGQVTAYSGTTLTVNVTSVKGSGTKTAWTILLSGPPGANGAGTGDMLAANNLSDVANAATARTNLGIGAVGVLATVAFANVDSGAVASQADATAGTSSTKLVTPQRVAQAIAALAPFGTALLHVRDEEVSGTSGGTGGVSGAWHTRVLNTTKTSEISGGSLVSNQVTLPAGTYWCSAMAIFANVNSGDQIRVQNITDSATLLTGLNGGVTTGSWAGNHPASVEGRFTLAGTKTIELQYRTGISSPGLGNALSFGTEVYADMKVWKVA